MNSIADMMRSFPDFIGSNGRSEKEITEAERVLELCFSPDYRQYLREIGLASFDGHELTGLTANKRLNVVSVTASNRNGDSDIPNSWYVIEEANIDGIVIWQNSSGEVFQAMPGTNAKKICDSLVEFVTRE